MTFERKNELKDLKLHLVNKEELQQRVLFFPKYSPLLDMINMGNILIGPKLCIQNGFLTAVTLAVAHNYNSFSRLASEGPGGLILL